MNTDGSGLVQLTSHPEADSRPAWSFDGSRIAFESMRDGQLEIYSMDSGGSKSNAVDTPAGVRRLPGLVTGGGHDCLLLIAR